MDLITKDSDTTLVLFSSLDRVLENVEYVVMNYRPVSAPVSDMQAASRTGSVDAHNRSGSPWTLQKVTYPVSESVNIHHIPVQIHVVHDSLSVPYLSIFPTNLPIAGICPIISVKPVETKSTISISARFTA